MRKTACQIVSIVLVVAGVNAALMLGLAVLNRPAVVAARAPEPTGVSVRSVATSSVMPAPQTSPPAESAAASSAALPQAAALTDIAPPKAQLKVLDFDVALPLPDAATMSILAQPSQTDSLASGGSSASGWASGSATQRQDRSQGPQGSGEPMSSHLADQPPRERPGNPQPVYPGVARHRGLEGTVTIRLLIDEQGHVRQVEVLGESVHDSFKQAVLAVADRWRFEPAMHQGRQVSVWGIKTIHFSLRN